MFKLTSLINKALLALMLAVTAGGAMAGPTYHVSVNTASFAGEGSAYMDFLLSSNVPAAQTIVTLSNFSGAFGAEAGRSGGVSGDMPGLVTLSNTDIENYLTQAVSFGGMFGFDVNFSGAFETTGGSDGAVFGVSLVNAAMSDYLAQDVVSFTLLPAFGNSPAMVDVTVAAGLADVAVVPEPSELLLLLTGLGLMGVMLRRRAR